MSDRTPHAELRIPDLKAALQVSGFRVEEALSQGYHARVEALSLDSFTSSDLLRKDAVFELGIGDAPPRAFRGVVLEAEVEEVQPGIRRMCALIVPRFLLLALRTRSRGYQEKGVEKVVMELLGEAKVAPFCFKLAGKHPARPFIAQLEEDDLEFARRLLHEEGITFCLRDGKGKEAKGKEEVFFFDDTRKADPIAGETVLFDRASTRLETDQVWDVRPRRQVASSAAAVRDYQPDKSQLHGAEARGAGGTGREVYFHPARCEEPQGSEKAQALLERLRSRAITFEGSSNCPRLQPGHHFTIQGHPRADVNVDQLLVSVIHTGSSEDESGELRAYENQFQSVPLDQPWRPPAPAPPPARGPQLAMIAAPSSEDVHTDQHGRVKVRFDWDRDSPQGEHSSAWLRVGQVPLDDSMLLPRTGFEVLVDFELGEADRPMVTGRLYNGEKMPPYQLPAQKTRSSLQSGTTDGGAGANELLFEDAAGAEEMHLIASRDLAYDAAHDASVAVGSNQTITIGEAHTLAVGTDSSSILKADRKLTVTGHQEVAVQQKYSDKVGYMAGPPDESLTVGGSRDGKVGGDDNQEVKGDLSRKVGSQRIIGSTGLSRQVVKDSTTQVTGLWAEAVGQVRASTCGGDRKQMVGAAKVVKAESFNLTAGLAAATTCMSLQSTCSGSRSESTQGGALLTALSKLDVAAKRILVTAQSKLTFRVGATTIQLEPDGTVRIKAPTIDLRGVKELGQIDHKSN